MEKKLSIFVGLFKKVGNNTYIEKYNNIKNSMQENIDLNGMTFYNNLENKKYFLLYVLYFENEESNSCELLGDYIIKNEEEVDSNKAYRVGFFKGVTGSVGFSFKKNLKNGRYELAILGKEIHKNEEIDEIRKKIKSNKNEIDEIGFEILASAPFNVEI